MLNRFLAALAAFAIMCGLLSSPALADEGDSGERVWVNSVSLEDAVTQIQDIIIRGDEACFGPRRNHVCYALSPLSLELREQSVSRPVGANKNIHLFTVINLDTGMAVQRNEAGVVLARFQYGAEQVNGTAMLIQGLTQMLPALANGLGAAGVQAVANPCGSGGCGGGGATVISVTEVSASAVLQAAIQGGGCATGTCLAPGHTQD